MKFFCLLFLTTLLNNLSLLAQRTEINFKEGMTIEVKERPTRDVRGSSERHDREPSSSKPIPTAPNIPKPPSKLSDESATSLQQINNIIRAIQSIKSLLVGNVLLGLFTDNPKEQLISIATQINNNDWAEATNAFKNLNKIQVQQIQKVTEATQFEISEKIDQYNREKKDATDLRKELKFWNDFEKALPSYVIIKNCSGFGCLESVTFESTAQVEVTEKITMQVEHNVIENGATGLKIYPKISIKNGHNKDVEAIAYFYLESGTPLKDFNNLYYTDKGTVCTSKPIDCCCTNSVTNTNYYLFIPLNELHLAANSRFELKFFISVFAYDQSLKQSDWYHFSATTN